MSILEGVYTGALTAARALLPLLSRGDGKFARGIRGRRGVLERMEIWARSHRDPKRPLVWLHAPSVGEGLQARPVLEEFIRRNPDVQTAFTFFSPSAEPLAAAMPSEFADYLPFDLPGDTARALELLRPSVIAFSKTDVWPNLTREAGERGIRLAILSGTLPATSSRLSGPARAFLLPAYSRLDHVAAISAEDAERFGALGVEAHKRSVMGDAHFDRVMARAGAVDRSGEPLASLDSSGGLTLVAGSTWAADEDLLIAAIAALLRTGIPLRTILVPHEPRPRHLHEAEERMAKLGLRHRRLSEGSGWEGIDVVLVDRVGVLGELYALADLAYVGGGWGTAGLHSVLEPAAFGVPILFGPHHLNAREAGELIRAGAAVPLQRPEQLEVELRSLVLDPAARARAGRAAHAYVAAGIGAALRGAEVLEMLLSRPTAAEPQSSRRGPSA